MDEKENGREKDCYRVRAEINLDAIYENAANAKKLLKEGTKLMAVVKADGYGHGAVEVANAVDPLTDAYGVATLEEGVELRKAGIKKPVLVLGFTPAPQYLSMIEYDISTAVFQFDMAKKMSDAAVKAKKKARAHIALDTGMGRIGFKTDGDSLEAIKKISNLPGISIEGCFTHFARMDEKDKTSAVLQLKRFVSFVEKMEEAGIRVPIKHASNSAGIIDMQSANLDMVRYGISLYGMYPSEDVDKVRLKLTPAMEIRACVSFVKTVEAGTEIGYGGTFKTSRRTTVATIPAGYADGYPRALSGRGRVLIRGRSAPILGRICMDQFMVDVTDIDGVREGDEATLIGRDGGARISMEEAADMAGSFNYEFACGVGKRVPRVYFRDGRKAFSKDFYSYI